MKLPIFLNHVQAGFPSPADDFVEARIDLNNYLISKPTSTFLLRVSGNSMSNLFINEGDILIVDKSLNPINGSIVIASIDGEFTVKIFEKHKKYIKLLPANPLYKALYFSQLDELFIWGVVKHVIHSFIK